MAIDGSKFNAVNARHRNVSARKLKTQTDDIDARIQEHLDELEKNDQEDADLPTPTAEQLKKKIENFRRRRKKLRDLRETIERSGQSQVSLTDPDSHSTPSRCPAGMPAGKGHGADVAEAFHFSLSSAQTRMGERGEPPWRTSGHGSASSRWHAVAIRALVVQAESTLLTGRAWQATASRPTRPAGPCRSP